MTLLHKSATALGWFLGVVYVILGSLKLNDWHTDIHNMMVTKFIGYSEVFPTCLLGLTPCPWPNVYRMTIGLVELVLGGCLILGSRSVKVYACQGLMFVMLNAVTTLIAVKDYSNIPITCLFHLGVNLVRCALHDTPPYT